MFPVNYHIRGRATEDRNDDEVQEYSNEAEKKTSNRLSINRAQVSMLGTKAEEALVKLTKAKDEFESMMRKEQADEAAEVDRIVSHIDKCHAHLDWECNRLRGKLLENQNVSNECHSKPEGADKLT